MDWQQRADVVVIGTGVAGLAAALAAHRKGSRTVILSKAPDTATFYAQGGIAVVLPHTDDSVDAHVRDTLAAGAGLCDPDAVRSIVADGYRAVADLVDDGARFDESAPGQWALTREGGHSRRRIIHAGGDATGAEVQRALDHAAATLDIRRNHVALQILHDGSAVTGVLVRNADGLGIVHAPSVILATGGLGHLYRATTNPEGSTGDGIALALWAGVGVTDLEFVQFHPTMLFDRDGSGRRPLITEALRGEGAVLRDARGDSVTAGVHPLGDLAPRDVVAAAIEARLRQSGDECVFLDARAIDRFAATLPDGDGGLPRRRHRPHPRSRSRSCPARTTAAAASPPTCTAAPSCPACSPPARWPAPACTAPTGWPPTACWKAWSSALAPAGRPPSMPAARARRWRKPKSANTLRWTARVLQTAMTQWASVVRDAAGLQRLTDALATATPRPMTTRAAAEDVALTVTARAVAAAALARTETRGCHHRGDHPDTDPAQAFSRTLHGDHAAACLR